MAGFADAIKGALAGDKGFPQIPYEIQWFP